MSECIIISIISKILRLCNRAWGFIALSYHKNAKKSAWDRLSELAKNRENLLLPTDPQQLKQNTVMARKS
jgi:hypothetical protein